MERDRKIARAVQDTDDLDAAWRNAVEQDVIPDGNRAGVIVDFRSSDT